MKIFVIIVVFHLLVVDFLLPLLLNLFDVVDVIGWVAQIEPFKLSINHFPFGFLSVSVCYFFDGNFFLFFFLFNFCAVVVNV